MIKRKLRCAVAFCGLTLLLCGCDARDAGPASADGASPSGPASAIVTDQWLGQWNGPEGTFLRLVGGNGKYEVTIQNLDGPLTFKGSAVGDAIQFERNGVKESIRATTGDATGMKWLRDKSNCLTVRSGEGYCRD